jgi:hypothetical protein
MPLEDFQELSSSSGVYHAVNDTCHSPNPYNQVKHASLLKGLHYPSNFIIARISNSATHFLGQYLLLRHQIFTGNIVLRLIGCAFAKSDQ